MRAPSAVQKTRNIIAGLSESQINITLFCTLAFLWSFTWFVGVYQVRNTILPEIAASYRFLFASVVVFACCVFTKTPIKINKTDCKTLSIYALFSCSTNFILFYYAAMYVVTGFSAVIFSFSVIFSAFIGKFFFGLDKNFNSKTIISASIGILGLTLIMMPSIRHQQVSPAFVLGIILGFMATISFSIGSVYYESKKMTIGVIPSFAYFCLFGGLLSMFWAFVHTSLTGEELALMPHFSFAFILSFIYMSLFSSAIGYMCLFVLIKRIGSVNTSYTSLVSPVLAMVVSSAFEGYSIQVWTFLGLGLILASRLFIMISDRRSK